MLQVPPTGPSIPRATDRSVWFGQDQWNSKYELLSTSVPDVDRLVPAKKRQMICTTIVFLLPPFCVFITCAMLCWSLYSYTVASLMVTVPPV